jgi:hypothetical protein
MGVRLSALSNGRALSPGIFLVLISVRGWVPRVIVRLEGLGKLKKITDIWNRNRALPVCSIRSPTFETAVTNRSVRKEYKVMKSVFETLINKSSKGLSLQRPIYLLVPFHHCAKGGGVEKRKKKQIGTQIQGGEGKRMYGQCHGRW